MPYQKNRQLQLRAISKVKSLNFYYKTTTTCCFTNVYISFFAFYPKKNSYTEQPELSLTASIQTKLVPILPINNQKTQ